MLENRIGRSLKKSDHQTVIEYTIDDEVVATCAYITGWKSTAQKTMGLRLLYLDGGRQLFLADAMCDVRVGKHNGRRWNKAKSMLRTTSLRCMAEQRHVMQYDSAVAASALAQKLPLIRSSVEQYISSSTSALLVLGTERKSLTL